MPGGSKDALRVLQGATLVLEILLREVSQSVILQPHPWAHVCDT